MLKKHAEERTIEYENWLEGYSLGTTAEEKLPYLERGLKESESPENLFRKKLFEKRYMDKKGRVTGADRFMALWMEMMYCRDRGTGFFGRREAVKICRQVLKEMCFEEASTESLKEVLYQELKNLAAVYINVSLSDRNYKSIIWGMGTMKDDSLKGKIAMDVASTTIAFPMMTGMEKELELLSLAAADAYITAFPFNEQLWMARKADAIKKYVG